MVILISHMVFQCALLIIIIITYYAFDDYNVFMENTSKYFQKYVVSIFWLKINWFQYVVLRIKWLDLSLTEAQTTENIQAALSFIAWTKQKQWVGVWLSFI